MKIAIVLNGLSSRKKFFYSNLLPVFKEHHTVDVFETCSATDAYQFSQDAVAENYELIVAAGGDGTVNQVVNGMLSTNASASELPLFSLLPVGSGNDFARTVNITLNIPSWRKRLESPTGSLLDVGYVKFQKENKPSESYFINVASAGMGPEVLNTMAADKKRLGSAVAYYVAILSTFFSYRCMPVSIKTSAWQWNNKLRTLAIGNGKFFGHGLCIAPDARPDDGMFSAFICGNVSVVDFIRYTTKLKNSKKINNSKVEYHVAEKLEVTSESPCRIEADGELLGFLPASIEVIPGRIKFLH